MAICLHVSCSDTTAGQSTSTDSETVDATIVEEQSATTENGGGETTPNERIVVFPVQDDFEEPCNENADCESGFCVEGPDGFICTQTCLEACPKGYACKAVSNLGPDTVFICVPDVSANPCEGKANGASCEDGSPCTEEEKCLDGSCIGGVEVVCDDGNACTTGECDFKYGCSFDPIEGPCEDNDVCTMGGTCEEGVCVGSEPMVCEDNDPCTDDICDPIEGCIYPESDCDDGNPGTLDLCLGDGCNNIETCDGLDSIPTPCSIQGKKGDTVPCEFNLVSANKDEEGASSLQAQVSYAPKLAKPVFFSQCKTCDTPLSSGLNLESGHTITYAPSALEDWTGEGEIIVISLGTPYPVTTAFIEGDKVEGDAAFVTLHFELLEDVDEPIPVLLKDIVAGDGDAAPLNHVIAEQTIITSQFSETCTENGEPCDDGNPCTVEETCVAKVCAAESKVCDDGEICTFDYCDSILGCFHQTAVDDCPCHDGDICTESGSCQQGVCQVEQLAECE